MRRNERLYVLALLDYKWQERHFQSGGFKSFMELFHGPASHYRYVIGKDRHSLILGIDLTKAFVVQHSEGRQYVVPAVIEFYDSVDHARFVLQMRRANNEF